LVLFEVRFFRIEEAARIQGLIPKELEEISMKVIGAAFGHHVHDGAGIAPIFGVKCVG
jgi:hypothetical protein